MPDRLPVDALSPIDIDDIADTGLAQARPVAARSVKARPISARVGRPQTGNRT